MTRARAGLPPPGEALAERFLGWAHALGAGAVPGAVRRVIERQIVDVAGLGVAARETDYVAAVLTTREGEGRCTAIGHARRLTAPAAALVNGTAAHGEDYDDTFEGSPTHPGAVVVPAVLAACEDAGAGGEDLVRGIAAGGELMCRLSLAAPGAIHRAGFHPTAVTGALAAAAGVATALRLDPGVGARALGIAGSMASGIIEYLAEGTSTKRLHAGWAAAAGIEAARLAAAGFTGPRTVLDGVHGFYHAFTNGDAAPDLARIGAGLGERWHLAGIAFKPYPCGTMAQPFIDCALALRAQGVTPDDVRALTCRVGEGTVHRLWEPLAEKRRPSSAYSAKFSVPFCVAVALVDGRAGLEQFTEARVRDPRVLAVAEKVGYEIDPDNEYPRSYTGHIRAECADGTVREADQPHLRGGVREPLTDAEIDDKFRANARHGGWDEARTEAALAAARTLCDAPRVRVGEALGG